LAGHEDEVGDAGRPRLVDGVLDEGAVHSVKTSLGTDLVAGRKRVPSPATGKTALVTLRCIVDRLLTVFQEQNIEEEAVRQISEP
jgi:hypothetical protein